MGYQLGIDLGTTYTAAAVCRSSDRGWVEPEVVSLGSRSATVAVRAVPGRRTGRCWSATRPSGAR